MPDDQLDQGIQAVDAAPLQTLCRNGCRNGLIVHRGRVVPCSCEAGHQIVLRDQAQTALTVLYGDREASRWLTDWHSELGDRPIHLLRNGHASRVMDVIGRLAADRGVAVTLPEAQPSEPSPVVSPVPSLQDNALQRVVGQLRTMGRLQAAEQLIQGQIDDMTDDDRAHFDALMSGTGFLIDGKRVDPSRVTVIRQR